MRAALGWEGEVILTSGASEAIAIAIQRCVQPLVAVSAVEHEAVLRHAGEARRLPVVLGGEQDGWVQVLDGLYLKRKMSRGVISAEEEAGGCVLACKIYPQSDLRVEVVGKMARAVEARKSASFDFGFATMTKINQPEEEK